MRGRMRARGQDIPPLPMLVVVIDEFYEWFRIMPTAVDVLDGSFIRVLSVTGGWRSGA
jgi:DNA segregation ATPase FtsK/SpoIIIE-like protein